jgi:ribosomal protein S18 acetylase RimI-like enzyme
MEIREALPKDAAGLLDHLKALQAENLDVINPITHLPSLEEEREYMNRLGREGGMLLVCESDGAIVGILSCVRMKKRTKPTGSIGMSVALSHRRKGIGEALLKRLIENVKRRNLYECLRLDVESRNLPARRLYEKSGFTYVASKKSDGPLEMEYMLGHRDHRNRQGMVLPDAK